MVDQSPAAEPLPRPRQKTLALLVGRITTIKLAYWAALTIIEIALPRILDRDFAGRFPFSDALEDIHMNIEARLTERIGEAGKRLHTARSRNDQVATDFRLWVRDAIDGLDAQLADVMRALADRTAAQ